MQGCLKWNQSILFFVGRKFAQFQPCDDGISDFISTVSASKMCIPGSAVYTSHVSRSFLDMGGHDEQIPGLGQTVLCSACQRCERANIF